MNLIWLTSGLLLLPISLASVALQKNETGFSFHTILVVMASLIPLAAFFGLAFKIKILNRLFWRLMMWLVLLIFLNMYIMPFLFISFGFPEASYGSGDGMYQIYIISGIVSIYSLLMCYGLYKYSEFVGKKSHA